MERKNGWKAQEVEYLRKWAGIKSTRELGKDLGRGKSTTYNKMVREGIEGLKPGPQLTWTESDFEDLRNVKPGTSHREFAKDHNKSGESVRLWAHRLGIRFESRPGRRPHDVERIRELAKTCTAKQAAEHVTLKLKGLHKLAQRNGFKFLPARAPAAPKAQRQPRAKVQSIRSAKAPRRVVVYAAPIEYCPVCHAPVSDWRGHYERMGHRRTA